MKHRINIVCALVLAGLTAGGCSKAPDPATQSAAPGPAITNGRIEQIEKDQSMSPEAKQKAIAILKDREAKTAPASP